MVTTLNLKHVVTTLNINQNSCDSLLKILISACSQFHLSVLKSLEFFEKKNKNGFVQAKAVCI